jgi:hypothetical protein
MCSNVEIEFSVGVAGGICEAVIPAKIRAVDSIEAELDDELSTDIETSSKI